MNKSEQNSLLKTNPKRIAVITGSDSTKNRLVLQLEKLLEGHATIEGYAVNLGLVGKIKADLIVFSSVSLQKEATAWIDPKCPQIIARRAIDIIHLDQLFSIRRGEMVLLVNDSMEATFESIELLQLLGIDNINLLPWCPEMFETERNHNINQCHVAITLGELELVPESMLHVVDLGPRIIDLSTIVEILHELDLLDEKSHYLSATYLATVVKMGKTIHKAMAEQELLNDRLKQVLHQIHDGLLAYDELGIIRVFSQKCELIFGKRSERVIGKPLVQIIKNENLIQFLKMSIESDESQEQLIMIEAGNYQVQRFTSGRGDWTVCTLRSLTESGALEQQNRRLHLQKGHIAKYDFEDIRHESEVMKAVVRTAQKIARTPLSILIYGESGTGKELFASAIHKASNVSKGPFLGVNFSALPEDLVESELFGYEEGAFTGAKKGGRPGLFEQAHGGTLFLDEIGDVSLKIQARLLRVLQEKEVMRVGGSEIIPVDVRIIAATNKPLMTLCEQGQFREDLYYRLKRLSLNTPPLRERREDIPMLLKFFLLKNGWRHPLETSISEALIQELQSANWKGNVRELESVVEYLVAVADGAILNLSDLPTDFIGGVKGLNKFASKVLNGDVPIETPIKIDRAADLFHRMSGRDYRFLLKQIDAHNKKGISIGREKLSLEANEAGLLLTQDMVRGRLKTLEQLGVIEVTKGRKGPVLTLLGLELLTKLDKS